MPPICPLQIVPDSRIASGKTDRNGRFALTGSVSGWIFDPIPYIKFTTDCQIISGVSCPKTTKFKVPFESDETHIKYSIGSVNVKQFVRRGACKSKFDE
ncbi:unnamed protein product [Caenorhabditis bovis]|uniref:Transthyretin-like family protein n=1 Tax=Caenorhabditis bovis TaxID=2654633 RepID=A0A8S1FAT7_9PELO|nr:unnamed protein product [Caenorhabditis bovis]